MTFTPTAALFLQFLLLFQINKKRLLDFRVNKNNVVVELLCFHLGVEVPFDVMNDKQTNTS